MRRSSGRVAAIGALLGAVLTLAGAGSALADGVAYAPPGYVWGSASYSDTATFGSPGYKQDYTWWVARDSSTQVCVQAWGFDAAHPKGKWFGAGWDQAPVIR